MFRKKWHSLPLDKHRYKEYVRMCVSGSKKYYIFEYYILARMFHSRKAISRIDLIHEGALNIACFMQFVNKLNTFKKTNRSSKFQ